MAAHATLAVENCDFELPFFGRKRVVATVLPDTQISVPHKPLCWFYNPRPGTPFWQKELDSRPLFNHPSMAELQETRRVTCCSQTCTHCVRPKNS